MTLNEWPIARLDDIAEPGAMEFKVGDADWPFRGIVVRWQGETFAFANVCAHLGHPLNLETDRFFNHDATLLICLSHGALFEPDTGVCVGGPCMGAGLRALDCRVRDGKIFVRAPSSQRS